MSALGEKIFGPYRLLKRIALGGMAELYHAHRVGAAGFVRDVALKRIHPEFSDDDEFVRMFINEAKIAAMLRHSNIVPVIDFDFVDGMYYLVMELVDGLDLKRLFLRSQREDQAIPVRLVVFMMMEALQGLAYAHHFSHRGQIMNVVHRDISPQNILVSVRGDVMLTDFGIARIQQHASITAHGVLKGKASYMAPEQTHTSQVDGRADLFSMGVVFWELLCQERLFQASHDGLVMEMVRSHPIPAPHTHNPQVDESLSALVMWSLERDLAQRVPDARIWLQHLQQWLRSSNHNEEWAVYKLRGELAEYVCRMDGRAVAPHATTAAVVSLPSNQEEPSPKKTPEWLPAFSPWKHESPRQTSAQGNPTFGEHAEVDTQEALPDTVQIEPRLLLSAAKAEIRDMQELSGMSAESEVVPPADVLTTVWINPKDYLQQMQSVFPLDAGSSGQEEETKKPSKEEKGGD